MTRARTARAVCGPERRGGLWGGLCTRGKCNCRPREAPPGSCSERQSATRTPRRTPPACAHSRDVVLAPGWLSLKPESKGGAGCREHAVRSGLGWPCDAPGSSSVPLCSLLWSLCQPPGGLWGWEQGGDPKGERRPPPHHATPETQGCLSPVGKGLLQPEASLLLPGGFLLPRQGHFSATCSCASGLF